MPILGCSACGDCPVSHCLWISGLGGLAGCWGRSGIPHSLSQACHGNLDRRPGPLPRKHLRLFLNWKRKTRQKRRAEARTPIEPKIPLKRWVGVCRKACLRRLRAIKPGRGKWTWSLPQRCALSNKVLLGRFPPPRQVRTQQCWVLPLPSRPQTPKDESACKEPLPAHLPSRYLPVKPSESRVEVPGLPSEGVGASNPVARDQGACDAACGIDVVTPISTPNFPTAYWKWLRGISKLLAGGGGAGSATTRRKRAAKAKQAQHDKVMKALAGMVHQWKAPKPKPRRKPQPNAPPQHEQPQLQRGQELARSLLLGLKTCLQAGGNEGDVLKLLAAALDGRQPELPPDFTHTPCQDESQRWQYGKWEGWDYVLDTATGQWWWDAAWPSEDTCVQSPQPVTQYREQTQKPNSTSETGAERQVFVKNPGDEEAELTQVPKVLSCRLQDWQSECPPKVVTFSALKAQLRQGLAPTGNLVELRTEQDVQELQGLWKAFGSPAPLTALLSASAKDTPGAFHTQACLVREKQRAAWEDIGLLKISSVKGPWTLPVKTIKADKVPRPDKETIRLVALTRIEPCSLLIAIKKTLHMRLSRPLLSKRACLCPTF